MGIKLSGKRLRSHVAGIWGIHATRKLKYKKKNVLIKVALQESNINVSL